MVLSKPLFAMLLLNVAIVAVLADPHPMNCPDFNIWK